MNLKKVIQIKKKIESTKEEFDKYCILVFDSSKINPEKKQIIETFIKVVSEEDEKIPTVFIDTKEQVEEVKDIFGDIIEFVVFIENETVLKKVVLDNDFFTKNGKILQDIEELSKTK